MAKPTVSLVIIALNEERTIAQVIDAAKPLVSEIILVDSGSSDATVSLATERGARVLHQDWLGFAAQKNFAIDQASGEWILSLDADEILAPNLVLEIEALLVSPNLNRYDGYKIPRILFIGEQPVTHGGFYPDAQLRLFKRGKGRFGQRLVHEAIKMNGPVAALKNPMNHYAYKDVAGFEEAMEKYARLSAREYFESGKYQGRASLLNEILHPQWTFFSRYFLRGGFLDGEMGLKLAALYSGYVRKKITYLREIVRERKGEIQA